MFQLLGKLSGMLCNTIDAADDLVTAGKCQTEIIKERSEFDVKKKRHQLDKELADFIALNPIKALPDKQAKVV